MFSDILKAGGIALLMAIEGSVGTGFLYIVFYGHPVGGVPVSSIWFPVCLIIVALFFVACVAGYIKQQSDIIINNYQRGYYS